MKNKLIIKILLFVVIVNASGFYFVFDKPKSAYATGIPVFDLPVGFNTFKEVYAGVQKAIKETLILAMKKLLFERATQAIIAKIQGKTGGVVPDFKQALKNVENESFGILAKNLGLQRLCSPFSYHIRVSLLPTTNFNTAQGCTLDQITNNVTGGIDGFLDDFKNGSWLAYNTAWEPNNNYYGAMISQGNKLFADIKNAKEGAKTELNTSQGFLSVKKCTTDSAGVKKCDTVTPGGYVAEAITKTTYGAKVDSLLGGGTAQYMTAIFNALINQMAIITQGLFEPPPEGLADGGSTDPCRGLDGEALNACRGLATMEQISDRSDKTYLLNRITTVSNYRKQAGELLTESYNQQNKLASSLADLYSCTCTNNINSNECIKINNDSILASEKADELNTKTEDNQTFIYNLEDFSSQISSSPNIIQAVLLYTNGESLVDEYAATSYLDEIKIEHDSIIAATTVQIPATESRIPSSCVRTLITNL